MTSSLPVAWVLRSSTTGFAVGCRVLQPDMPQFGSFVKVPVTEGLTVIGLVYDVRVNDDPSVRQLILAGDLSREAILDQRENRLVPIEMSVLVIGYRQDGLFVQNLPPQPPITLDELYPCTADEIKTFTERLDYLSLIVKTRQIPVDEVIVANLTHAAATYPAQIRSRFLLEAAREISRLLSSDLIRLDNVLRRVHRAAELVSPVS
jgi:hypothetical protein